VDHIIVGLWNLALSAIESLRKAVERAESGQIDADLGGGVVKQRISRPGEGRSGGYRTVILFRQRTIAVFVYGFAKKRQANLGKVDLAQYKQAAKHVLSLTESQLVELLRRGDFAEVRADE
jgi:hypothetical protein